jgi:hypothetical protein
MFGELEYLRWMTIASLYIDAMYPEFRLNREFLRTSFPTLAEYAK